MLVKSARDVYEHLGTIIITSLLWAVPIALAIGGLAIGSPVGQAAFTAGWILFGPVTVAAWTVGLQIASDGPRLPGIRDFLFGLRHRTVVGLVFFLVEVLITALLVANVRFYFTSTLGILGHPVRWLGRGIRVGHLVGLLWLSPLTLWALMQLYAVALLVYQPVGIGRTLRRSALLVLDNLLFTLALAVVVVLLAGLLALSGIGMFALFGGVMAVLTSNATVLLLNRYSREELAPQRDQE